MFPICHIYFADRVFGSISDFSVLGSIYPDAVISKVLNRDVTHYNTKKIYQYFKNDDEYMKEFALGAESHGVDMKGIDYYSDEKYLDSDRGYCFLKGKRIEKEVIDCCHVPENLGLWKAHNFIEMAFELYLDNKNSYTKELFKNALSQKSKISYISRKLSSFYGIEASYFEKKFCNFSYFFDYEHVNAYTMAQKYSLQLYQKHGIKNMDVKLGASAILKGVDIIKEDAESFLDYVVRRFKADIDLQNA